jgi:hypothetical protein
MKDFNPGADDGRRVGVPDNGLLEREPQHNSRSSSLDQHRLSAAALSTRHDFVFAAQHLNHERFTQQNFRLSCDETIQLALIPRFFYFVWNGRDLGRKQAMRKTHVWLCYSEPTASCAKPSLRSAANRQPARTK